MGLNIMTSRVVSHIAGHPLHAIWVRGRSWERNCGKTTRTGQRSPVPEKSQHVQHTRPCNRLLECPSRRGERGFRTGAHGPGVSACGALPENLVVDGGHGGEALLEGRTCAQ